MNQCHEIKVRAKVMRLWKMAMETCLICMTYDLALV